MKAYMKALVKAHQEARKSGRYTDAKTIQEMWDEAMYEYAQSCGIQGYEAQRKDAEKIASDFFRA